MSKSTYFIQECPTCGRRLQIRVEYLGREVMCQHCQGQFVASEPANARGEDAGYGNELLRRADELLDTVARRRVHCRLSQPK